MLKIFDIKEQFDRGNMLGNTLPSAVRLTAAMRRVELPQHANVTLGSNFRLEAKDRISSSKGGISGIAQVIVHPNNARIFSDELRDYAFLMPKEVSAALQPRATPLMETLKVVLGEKIPYAALSLAIAMHLALPEKRKSIEETIKSVLPDLRHIIYEIKGLHVLAYLLLVTPELRSEFQIPVDQLESLHRSAEQLVKKSLEETFYGDPRTWVELLDTTFTLACLTAEQAKLQDDGTIVYQFSVEKPTPRIDLPERSRVV